MYLVTGYALHLLAFTGGEALILLVMAHIGFGIAGYFMFNGSLRRRSIVIFSVVLLIGIVFEFISPDPRHGGVQIFVAIPLGIIAATATLAGRFLERLCSGPKALKNTTPQ